MQTATYTKLKSGDWGVRIAGVELAKGSEHVVTVTKKSGEMKRERVKIIWSGNGVSLAVVQQDRSARYSYAPRRGCKGCGGPIRDAAHHRAMGGYCGSCAFDEFDC